MTIEDECAPTAVDPVLAQMVADAIAGTPDPACARRLAADAHDFAGLYIRHRGSFAGQARRFLRDERDVDEVVQEGFLRLFLALPELETELQALAYCRRTVTNLCIDRYRAEQRRPHLLDLDSIPPDLLAEDEPADPVVRAEDAAIVRTALSLLSPLHREALVKREIEEKSLPVIASELDIPEERVKHVLYRARRALRRTLAGTSVAPEGVSTARLLGRRCVADGGRLAVGLALLIVALGLSSGPNLHAIPLVGRDLPNLPSLIELTKPAPAPPPAAPAVAPVPATTGTGTSGGTGPAPRLQPSASPSVSPSARPSTSASPAAVGPALATPAAPQLSPSASPTGAPVSSAAPSPTASPVRPQPGIRESPGPSASPQPASPAPSSPAPRPSPS